MARVRLVLVAMSAFFSLSAMAISAEVPSLEYEAFLSCSVVVRGSVASIASQQAPVADVMSMFMSTFPDPGSLVEFKEVTLSVDEVLKGELKTTTITFNVNVCMSTFRDNYMIGEECIVGLKWSPDALGGVYYLFSDRARLVEEGHRWVQQGERVETDDIGRLRATLAAAAPRRVLGGADLVISGRLRSSSLSYLRDADGHEYAEETLHLENVETLKGVSPGTAADVKVITSGDYWPAWREEGTVPKLLEGYPYCLFLRKTDQGLVLFRGLNSAFEIDGNALRAIGARYPTDLNLNEVSADARPVNADFAARWAVPLEAERVAQASLADHWKPEVESAPTFFDLVGVNCSDAKLAAPFHEYLLREEAVRRFILSGDDDPRPYWTLERYAFPIMVQDSCVGMILVQRNRDESGKKFEEERGRLFLLCVHVQRQRSRPAIAGFSDHVSGGGYRMG